MDTLEFKTRINTPGISGAHIDQNWADIQEREHPDHGALHGRQHDHVDRCRRKRHDDVDAVHRHLFGPPQLPRTPLVLRGDWLAETDYAVADIVLKDGSSYICKIAHDSTAHSDDDLDALYWQLLAQGGTGGGGGGSSEPAIRDKTIYDADYVVSFTKNIGAILMSEASALTSARPIKATMINPIGPGDGDISYELAKVDTDGLLTTLGIITFTGGTSRFRELALDVSFAVNESLVITQSPRTSPPSAGYPVFSIPLLPTT